MSTTARPDIIYKQVFSFKILGVGKHDGGRHFFKPSQLPSTPFDGGDFWKERCSRNIYVRCFPNFTRSNLWKQKRQGLFGENSTSMFLHWKLIYFLIFKQARVINVWFYFLNMKHEVRLLDKCQFPDSPDYWGSFLSHTNPITGWNLSASRIHVVSSRVIHHLPVSLLHEIFFAGSRYPDTYGNKTGAKNTLHCGKIFAISKYWLEHFLNQLNSKLVGTDKKFLLGKCHLACVRDGNRYLAKVHSLRSGGPNSWLDHGNRPSKQVLEAGTDYFCLVRRWN